MLCSASLQRDNQIKSTHYDETKKMTHDSQIVRAYDAENMQVVFISKGILFVNLPFNMASDKPAEQDPFWFLHCL